MNDLEKAKAIISKILYATVATVSEDGQPWNTPVFSAFDEKYNFYWGSHRDSQHSKNIRANGRAFLVIYDSTVEAGAGVGVYIETVATELDDESEIKSAHQLLQSRSTVPYWRLEQVKEVAPIRLYKVVPRRFWINGEVEVDGNCIDTRVEINLLEQY